MKSRILRISLAATAAALCACTSGGSSIFTSTAAISAALATASGAQCLPGPQDLSACQGKAAGDSCTITDPHDTDTGTCAANAAGALVCARTPRPLPSFLTDACASKAAGDPCIATAPDGDKLTGACTSVPVNGSGGTTLACFRQRPAHAPPPEATAACAQAAKGDACSFALGSYTIAGTCALAADGSTLTCAPGCELGRGPDDDADGGEGHHVDGGDADGDHGDGGHDDEDDGPSDGGRDDGEHHDGGSDHRGWDAGMGPPPGPH